MLAFLRSYVKAPRPPLPPILHSASCLSFSVFLCVDGRAYWRVGKELRESPALYKSFNPLWVNPIPAHAEPYREWDSAENRGEGDITRSITPSPPLPPSPLLPAQWKCPWRKKEEENSIDVAITHWTVGTIEAKCRREMTQHDVLPRFTEGEWPIGRSNNTQRNVGSVVYFLFTLWQLN